MNDDEFYEQAGVELKNDSMLPGPYARALAEAKGAPELARALYVRFRVAELKEARMAAAKEQARIEVEKVLLESMRPKKPASVDDLPRHLQERLRFLEEMEESGNPEEKEKAKKFKGLLLQFPEDDKRNGFQRLFLAKLCSSMTVGFCLVLPVFFSRLDAVMIFESLMVALGVWIVPALAGSWYEAGRLRQWGVTTSCPIQKFMRNDLIVAGLFVVTSLIVSVMVATSD